MAVTSDFVLTPEQKAQFLELGFIKIPQCFTRAQAAEWTSTMWTRLGMSPTDKSTWTAERTNMPSHRSVMVQDFAPKAWSGMCQLLGGEERISETMRSWNDGFIVNLGKEEYNADSEVDYRELDGWHNDGDFFIHFLDSPEQALLVIPLWSDIKPKGGGTALCTDGIKIVAKHLYDRPEGTSPYMKSRNLPNHVESETLAYWNGLVGDKSLTRDESFFEATGEVGDVYLLHPLMVHSASKNLTREHRIITNPPVSLKEPFNFDRKDPKDYSLVELKTLQDLGMPDGLKGWKITKPRAPWIPARLKKAEEMKKLELERLAKVNSMSSQ